MTEDLIPPEKLHFKIGEVSQILNLPIYTLRFWEKEFPQLDPGRSNGKHRRYSRADIEVLMQIKDLIYEQGLKVEAAKRVLKVSYRKSPPRRELKCDMPQEAIHILEDVAKMVSDNRHALSRLQTVIKWIKSREGVD